MGGQLNQFAGKQASIFVVAPMFMLGPARQACLMRHTNLKQNPHQSVIVRGAGECALVPSHVRDVQQRFPVGVRIVLCRRSFPASPGTHALDQSQLQYNNVWVVMMALCVVLLWCRCSRDNRSG